MATIGRLQRVGFAKETTRGTAASAPTFWVPHRELTVDDRVEMVYDEAGYGVIEDATSAEVITKYAEMRLSATLGVDHLGLMLLAALGSVSTSGTGTTKTHDFSVNQSTQHPTLTLFSYDPDTGGRAYALGALTSLGVSVEVGGYATYEATFNAKVGQNVSLTPAASSEPQFHAAHGNVKFASDLAGLDAASPVNVRRASFTINKNTERYQTLGNTEPSDFFNRNLTVEGEAELLWDSVSFRDVMLAGTPQAVRLEFVNTNATLTDGSNPLFRLDLAKAHFNEVSRAMGLNDVVMQTITFRGVFSLSDGASVKAQLVNDVAAY